MMNEEKTKEAIYKKQKSKVFTFPFLLFTCFLMVISICGLSNAAVITFDELPLSEDSYWNGSNQAGGFNSSGAWFNNYYDRQWQSWESFSYSNISDKITTGQTGQYNSITGSGHSYTPNYAVCFVGWSSTPAITFSVPHLIYGLYVTNNNTAYYSMLKGDMFSKKFGSTSGSDPDWFKLTITGKNIVGTVTGTVDVYLADYRFADSNDDYITDIWRFVDLTSLGEVKSIEFSLSSSDSGVFGMNTPGYFALDTIIYQGEIISDHPYTETGIKGYIDPNTGWSASPLNEDAWINPIFNFWASAVVDYNQTDGVASQWSNPANALGPATGNVIDIFSLGELSREQIEQKQSPGWITLFFDEPIRNNKGYDFAVFENAIISEYTTTTGSAAGQLLAELAYVEVSSDGENFTRFPCVSLTEQLAGSYGTIETGRVYNLAGKHPNSYNVCTGTPFDLQDIINNADVNSLLVDINDIRFVRIVDIPGTGDFYDDAINNIDPNSVPDWRTYTNNHPIFDFWPSWGSGGFDLEAIGVLHEQQYSADIDLNGVVDIHDFDLMVSAWLTHFGQNGYIARCDLAEPKDMFINMSDFDIFISQWEMKEIWCYKE
jgi:hypothetical protein